MGLCYADRDGPSMSLPDKDVAPHGHGARGQRGHARKVIAGHGANTSALESHKQKHSERGRGISEPADIRIDREIASKVGEVDHDA